VFVLYSSALLLPQCKCIGYLALLAFAQYSKCKQSKRGNVFQVCEHRDMEDPACSLRLYISLRCVSPSSSLTTCPSTIHHWNDDETNV